MSGIAPSATGVADTAFIVAQYWLQLEAQMSQSHEDRIRQRAYALWERAGSPSTHSQDFWRKAERELAEERSFEPERSARVTQPNRPAGTPAR
jgi:Protein of unknown function (DUF2934)